MIHAKLLSDWLRSLSAKDAEALGTRIAARVVEQGIVNLSRRNLYAKVAEAVFKDANQNHPDSVTPLTLARSSLFPTLSGNATSEQILIVSKMIEEEYHHFYKTTPPGVAEKVEAKTMGNETMKGETMKSTTMTKEEPSKIRKEMNQAAWFIFTSKSTEYTQQFVAAALQRNLGEDSPELRAQIGQFMETELGKVITGFLLSVVAGQLGGTLAEKFGGSPEKWEYAASQYRVMAMASGGKALIDELADPFMEQIQEFIRNMPQMPDIPGQVQQLSAAPERVTTGTKTKEPVTVDAPKKAVHQD